MSLPSAIKKIKQLHTLKDSLAKAIANLEQLTHAREATPLAPITHLCIKENLKAIEESASGLKGKMTVIKECISLFFSKQARDQLKQRRQIIQSIMEDAVNTIKRSAFLIEKLKKGTSTEQQLVNSTLSTIKRFNAIVEDQQRSSSWKTELTRFLDMCTWASAVEQKIFRERIDLPRHRLIQYHKTHRVTNRHLEDAGGNRDPLSAQEADALRVKAGRLLSMQRIKVSAENLLAIRIAPIRYALDPTTSTSTLSLTIHPLPGSEITVQGSFKRDETLYAWTTPLPKSFQLFTSIQMMGFPHPSQYVGWALATPFVHVVPYYLEKTPHLKMLLERTKALELEWFLGSPLFERACTLLHKKRATFIQHKQDLLPLHRNLMQAIVRANNQVIPPDALNNFFIYLEESLSPMEMLSFFYEQVVSCMMIQPLVRVEEGALERSEGEEGENFSQEMGMKVFGEEQQKGLQQLSLNTQHPELACLLGSCIGEAAAAMMTQYFPGIQQQVAGSLTLFQKKMQTAAFRQWRIFLEELEGAVEGNCHMGEYMEELLKADIALFDANSLPLNSPESQFVAEMSIYTRPNDVR